jgi:SPP1 gp7 family putative phage head morphogenesis protein
MTLATALRQRALMAQAFGVRRPRVRRPPLRPARFPSSARLAYLRGLLELLDEIQRSITQHVVPQLPRLVQAHASTRGDGGTRRIAIVGAPRAGKTTTALELVEQLGLPIHHADDLIELGWSEASDALAELIGATEGGAIFEGVAVVRALRKLLNSSAGKPVDQVLVLRTPHVPLTPGQARMATACETILREIAPALQARGVELVSEISALMPSAPRFDAPGDSVTDLFDLVRDDVAREIPEKRIKLLGQDNALRVSEHTRGELDKQIKQVVKIDIFAPDTGVPDHIQAFVAQQVQLIKGLTETTLAQTHSTVLDGLRQGLRAEEITKNLREKVGLSKTKATIIANDQVGKLNGELTQLRQRALGIKRYKWATSRDELVRPGHRALDGTVQKWGEPPLVNAKTGKRAHPGFDTHYYPCRCSAIPMIEDLLEEAGLTAPAAAEEPKLPPVPATLPKPPPANVPAQTKPAAALPPPPPPSPPGSPPSPPSSPPSTPPRVTPVPTLPQPPPANVTTPQLPAAPPVRGIPAWMTAKDAKVYRDVPVDEGENGARKLTLADSKHGVWKAARDEQHLRSGIKAGSFHQREAAVYELDALLGGETVVPPTVSRWLQGEQGSLQRFAPNAKRTEEVFRQRLSEQAAEALAQEPLVRRQFLLDVITANDDRHERNTLWRKAAGGKLKPVAIDNGLTFPDGPPLRFVFAIPDGNFQWPLLELDQTSVTQLQNLKLSDVAALLHRHEGITEPQIREALARIRSLQNDPAQFVKLREHDNSAPRVVHQWLRQRSGERATLGQISDAELAEISQLAKRP